MNGPGAIAMAAKAGFDGIQIGDLGGAEQGYPMNSPAVQEAYLQAASDYNIVLQSLHPYGLQRAGGMLYPCNTPQGQQGMEEIKHCIEACVAMNIPSLMVSSFFATLLRNEWDFNAFAEQLRYACQLGRDNGVRIVYESVLTPKRILRMIEVAGDDLTICYDTLNPIRWGTGDPLNEIPQLLPHIDHFHVKDAPFNLKGYEMIGKGAGKFLETAKLIRETGYSGWLVSENYYTLLAAAKKRDFIDLEKQDIEAIRATFAD